MIERYVIAEIDTPELDHEYDDYQEALASAQDKADQTNRPWHVIARQYEYLDSELVATVIPGDED